MQPNRDKRTQRQMMSFNATEHRHCAHSDLQWAQCNIKLCSHIACHDLCIFEAISY